VAYGIDVRLDVGDGAAGGLPDATSRAVVRVVQEGLTNATRHATGASVRVVLRRTPDAIEVTVTNGPPAAGAAQRDDSSRPGYGLVGLDERVRLVGGTVTAGPAGPEDPAGWVLAARLPVTPSLGSAPSAPGSPQAALAGARRRLRRGLIITFWTPAVLAVVLVAVFLLRGGTL
jgi:signal transduction histidine kinase